ncbi:MAG TPA: hypothetical protein PK760_07420 [Flavobacteriales bacterium]|nr:hypothetical protein [Flavobacteriales bacterium]
MLDTEKKKSGLPNMDKTVTTAPTAKAIGKAKPSVSALIADLGSLQDVFRTLLHVLMTGNVRVSKCHLL